MHWRSVPASGEVTPGVRVLLPGPPLLLSEPSVADELSFVCHWASLALCADASVPKDSVALWGQ